MPYHHFTTIERYKIAHMAIAGFSLREIGRRIGRHHTSISREIARNRPTYADDAVYQYGAGEFYAKERRHKARHRRRQHERLLNYVMTRLREDWSPEAISGRLKVDFPEDDTMRISSEIIYCWIYKDSRNKGDLHHHLRRRHKYRRRQKRYGTGRRFIPGRIRIHERPPIVTERIRFGDWEGDTMEGGKGSGGLMTHVERKSRYLIAARLPDKKAISMSSESIRHFRKVPKPLRVTLTVDNGTEFSQFKDIEKKTGLAVYFADPYAAWQRGTNENTNGLLRFYFPKGSDFRQISEKEVALVVKKLNNRPRKCLNYQTPYEVYRQALGGAL
jgi:transposase, IS30 family